MKQAFIILAHSYPNHLKKLLIALDNSNFDIYVHIDKKSNLEINDFDKICKMSRLYIYKESKLYWGGINIVMCELNMFEHILKNKTPYSYIHLLSGEDYPIRKIDDIYDFFSNKEFDFVETCSLDKKEEYKVKYFHVFQNIFSNRKISIKLNKVFIFFQKAFGVGKRIKNDYFKGTQWVSIKYDTLIFLTKLKNEIYKEFRFVFCPDELFIPTILKRNGIKTYNYNYNLRLIDWERGGPYLFCEKDIEEIISNSSFFCRKVNVEKNDLVYLIDREILYE